MFLVDTFLFSTAPPDRKRMKKSSWRAFCSKRETYHSRLFSESSWCYTPTLAGLLKIQYIYCPPS